MLNSRKGKAVIFIVALALVLGAALATSAPAQEKKAPEKKAEASDTIKANAQAGKAGAADPNVKKADVTNDPKAAAGKAPAHRGATTRGFGPGVCGVAVENWTALYTKIYVDGTYRGTLGPWDEGIVFTGSGATTMYARADFTDGSYKYWGPSVVNCPRGGRHTWELH